MSLTLDPSNYPASATVIFKASIFVSDGFTSCLRLFDLSADLPVEGSDVCVTDDLPPPSPGVVGRGEVEIALAARSHVYALQGRSLGTSAFVGSITDVRVVFDW